MLLSWKKWKINEKNELTDSFKTMNGFVCYTNISLLISCLFRVFCYLRNSSFYRIKINYNNKIILFGFNELHDFYLFICLLEIRTANNYIDACLIMKIIRRTKCFYYYWLLYSSWNTRFIIPWFHELYLWW